MMTDSAAEKMPGGRVRGRLLAQVFLLLAQLAICTALLFYDLHLRDLAGASSWVSAIMYLGYFSLEYFSRKAPALEPAQSRAFTFITRFVLGPVMLSVLCISIFAKV